jgi:hypothetical protein
MTVAEIQPSPSSYPRVRGAHSQRPPGEGLPASAQDPTAGADGGNVRELPTSCKGGVELESLRPVSVSGSALDPNLGRRRDSSTDDTRPLPSGDSMSVADWLWGMAR